MASLRVWIQWFHSVGARCAVRARREWRQNRPHPCRDCFGVGKRRRVHRTGGDSLSLSWSRRQSSSLALTWNRSSSITTSSSFTASSLNQKPLLLLLLLFLLPLHYHSFKQRILLLLLLPLTTIVLRKGEDCQAETHHGCENLICWGLGYRV